MRRKEEVWGGEGGRRAPLYLLSVRACVSADERHAA